MPEYTIVAPADLVFCTDAPDPQQALKNWRKWRSQHPWHQIGRQAEVIIGADVPEVFGQGGQPVGREGLGETLPGVLSGAT